MLCTLGERWMRESSYYRRALHAYVRARSTADRVLERTFTHPMQRIWTSEAAKLTQHLGRALARATELTPVVLVHAARQLRGGLMHTARTMGEALSKTTQATLSEGYRATADAVRYVQQMATPLDNLATHTRVLMLRQRELERLRRDSANGLAGDVHAVLIDRMQRVTMQGGTVTELVDQVGELAENQAWRVERLVRTETSYAYNLAQADAIEALSHEHEYRGVMQRWTEKVIDGPPFNRPMDNRVGRDSMQMHGQVARPGGAFSAPAEWRVPGSWTSPPNRPNDRAVLTPWLRSWGVPAWMWQAGRRIDL